MLLYPAIDLMAGHVVRLEQGKADRKTVYSEDAPAMGLRWQEEGGDWLHIVDLDAAFSGEHRNLEVVRRITEAINVPAELGGGMRSPEAVANALAAGVTRVVIGTRAAESLDFVGEMVRAHGAERVAVGIDAKDGMVAVRGWTETSKLPALDLARQVEDRGVRTIIYTDIATDGMLQGPNFAELAKISAAVRCQIIASGGVTRIEDIERLCGMKGIHGAIIGKALYDGALSLREARACCDRHAAQA